MTYSIVYVSRTGNTRLIAEAIRDALPSKDCLYFGPPSPDALEAGLILAGFWTDKGSCSETFTRFLATLSGKRVALFGTAGFGGAPEYFEQILARVRSLLPEDSSFAGGFLCQGRMPEAVGARYRAALAEKAEDTRSRALLENFEQARSHPDSGDLKRAAAFAAGLTGN